MLLAIDVGNSETKLGLFLDGAPSGAPSSQAPRGAPSSQAPLGGLVRTWRIETARRRTADEFGVLAATLFRVAGIADVSIGAVAISSVVPQADDALAEAMRAYFHCEPHFFSAATQTMIEVTTERPKELGADLLAAAIGAKAEYGAPAIVVGFGTATTFGAISREGEYVGAAIAPGIRISIDALVERTAKLPQVALDAPAGPIGRDTISALQAGIVFGFVGQAEALIARMRHAIGEDARVIATGGLADVVAKHTDAIDAVEPHLVLKGLARWYAASQP